MFVNLALILIILSQTQKIQSLFVSVGDYSNESIPGLNTPECGLSALPIVYHLSFEKSYEKNCFRNKYKNKTLIFFDIHNTREKTPVISRVHKGTEEKDASQTPWVVFLGPEKYFGLSTSRCTGVLITFEWILTAAHCYEDLKSEILSNIIGYLSLTISLGANNKVGAVSKIIYKNSKFISHPLFINPRLPGSSAPLDELTAKSIKDMNDIALIKVPGIRALLRPDDRYLINTICLSKRDEVNEYFVDLATFYGYGRWNDDYFIGIFPDYLHKGSVYLTSYRSCGSKYLCGYSKLESPKVCKGDSGGPLVQFVGSGIEKRAVLVGISKGMSTLKCIEDKMQYWVPTSKFITWILETMSEN